MNNFMAVLTLCCPVLPGAWAVPRLTSLPPA